MEKTQNNETILYQGNILEIVQKIVGEKIFEIARRSP
jgi:hypothetical protein